MIRIKKPRTAPKILRERGKQRRRDMSRNVSTDPQGYHSGARKFAFDNKLYGAKSVKNALLKAQHGKCGFCESKLTHISFGDVEHFRPKGGFRQKPSHALQQPGYYWLAYEWSNLLLSCQLCNQRFKKNLFPLSNPRSRARSHRDRVNREQPLFIDPSAEDPRTYISFRQEIPYAVRNQRRGKVTIKALALDRDELNERRRTRLNMVWALKIIIDQQPGTADARKASRLLKQLQQDDAEYAAMVRANLT